MNQVLPLSRAVFYTCSTSQRRSTNRRSPQRDSFSKCSCPPRRRQRAACEREVFRRLVPPSARMLGYTQDEPLLGVEVKTRRTTVATALVLLLAVCTLVVSLVGAALQVGAWQVQADVTPAQVEAQAEHEYESVMKRVSDAWGAASVDERLTVIIALCVFSLIGACCTLLALLRVLFAMMRCLCSGCFTDAVVVTGQAPGSSGRRHLCKRHMEVSVPFSTPVRSHLCAST